jgi:hypothetical protein
MTRLEGPSAASQAGRAARTLFAVISSPRLAIGLLIAVLLCCVAGATVFRGERAWAVIFSTLWFNGLLVLLALSSGLTFLVRVWARKLTLVWAGMVVFHVSFLGMLGGVAYNSLHSFNGLLRLTEGETLPNGEPGSYDKVEQGRFFDLARLRGETTLIRMHRDYKVEGQDKRAAYEIEVGEAGAKATSIIYMTQNLERDGVRYLVEKEGYSVGVVLHDRRGKELYGAMVPLQSLPRGPGSTLYVTGAQERPTSFPFPPPPAAPALLLQVSYVPHEKRDRDGQVVFDTWPVSELQGERGGAGHGGVPVSGQVPVGGRFEVGEHVLEAREVRYWVGMRVRHDPGLMVILTSLWAGLAGMTMTFTGRVWQDVKRGQRETKDQAPGAAPGEKA